MSTAIAGKTMFSTDVEAEAAEIVQALAVATSLFSRASIPFSEWLLKLPLPSTFRFYRAKARLDATIYRMINERRHSARHYGDLLSLLLLAQDEGGDKGTMTDQQVRDEALTLFLTAFDTTSLALTWTWYLLSQHAEVEADLHAELDRVLGGRMPTVDDMPKLQYTRMVLTEAIRLYPPVYVIARKALNDFSVDKYIVPANTLILMSPYLMQHDSRFYPEPNTFNPKQWASDTHAQAPKYAYFPFGGGPRSCIGESFAWMEGMLVIAALAQSWKMRTVPGHPVALLPLVNLRPKYGMAMIVQRRR
jgi:cytochrome P450